MKKKLALLATPVIMLAASTAAQADFGFTPYVGADVQYRDMSYQTGFGQNLFAHHQPQGNLYVGAKLHEYFGIEAGYQSSNRKSRTATLLTGDTYLGYPVGAGNPGSVFKYTTTTRIKGPHISLLAFAPISEEYRLKLIGIVGLSTLKATSKITNTYAQVAGFSSPLAPNREFSQRKTVLRLGAGVEHMFTCNWGVRGSLIWENTAKIKAPLINPTTGAPAYLVKPKNALVYGLGAFFSF